MKIKDFILNSMIIGTLALTGCASKKPVIKQTVSKDIVDITTKMEGDVDKLIEEAFKNGKIAYHTWQNRGLNTLEATIGKWEINIKDGCYNPGLFIGRCEYDNEPDYCEIRKDNVLVSEHLIQSESKIACGTLYRKIEENIVRTHTKKILNMIKNGAKIVKGPQINEDLSVTIGDENTSYYIFHSEKPDVEDIIRCIYPIRDTKQKLLIRGSNKGIKNWSKYLIKATENAPEKDNRFSTELPASYIE